MIYFVFGLNVLFSAVCGYFAVFEAEYVSVAYLGWPLLLVQLIGVGLALFAVLVGYLLFVGMTLGRGLFVIVQDFIYIFAVALLAGVLGVIDWYFVVFIDVIVFVIAVLQYVSLFGLILHPQKIGGFEFLVENRRVVASSSRGFWGVLSEFGGVHKYAPNVTESNVITDAQAMDAVRKCTNGKGAFWTEEVYEWNEGEGFSTKFDVEVEGFPFPVSKMNGGWTVSDTAGLTYVSVWFEFSPKNWVTRYLAVILCYFMVGGLSPVIENMDEAALDS